MFPFLTPCWAALELTGTSQNTFWLRRDNFGSAGRPWPQACRLCSAVVSGFPPEPVGALNTVISDNISQSSSERPVGKSFCAIFCCAEEKDSPAETDIRGKRKIGRAAGGKGSGRGRGPRRAELTAAPLDPQAPPKRQVWRTGAPSTYRPGPSESTSTPVTWGLLGLPGRCRWKVLEQGRSLGTLPLLLPNFLLTLSEWDFQRP